MSPELLSERREIMPEPHLDQPAAESFLDRDLARKFWPENIAGNEKFLEQIDQRRELCDSLDAVINSLPRPDVHLSEAIKNGRLSEEQAARMYSALNKMLEQGRDYQRIILYLPFEFLPNESWQPAEENLRQALGDFKNNYLAAWHNLLDIQDVRANFVDGDVLEVSRRSGDLPRVVKAAHLAPKLVASGMLKVEDIDNIITETDDQLLRESLGEALAVIADSENLAEKKAAEAITPADIQNELSEKFKNIDQEDFGDSSEKRKKWLQEMKKQEAIDLAGEKISAAILDDSLSAPEGYLSSGESRQAFVEGARLAIEAAAETEPEKASSLYSKYEQNLLELWRGDDREIKNPLAKTFRRLNNFGIVSDAQLADLNIIQPKLSGRLSENLAAVKEMPEIRAMVAKSEKDPELSRLIYPVAMVYGSRLKGYGEADADIDLAVFVRPGIALAEREKLQELLKNNFAHDKIGGQIAEFWLEEKGNELSVRDLPERDTKMGESFWTHVLFGAAGVGDEQAMSELREKLLAPYLRETDKKIMNREARGLYLEEMERDILQYRLLHKGYERFFPPAGGLHSAHADKVDGESMFWDSGYRQLATKLFASRVFLPKFQT